jgi:methanogenic corrinoid protein MtbC1
VEEHTAASGGHEAERLARLRAIGRLRESYADAVMAGDEGVAERTIREALDAALTEGVIHDAIIAPAMRRVGDLWAQGDISVADEHLATHITVRMVTLMRDAVRVAERRPEHRVLLAGIQDERHTVGLEMAGSVLTHGGYEVLALGADVPVDALPGAVERHRPAVVGLSATLAATAKLIPAAIYAMRAVDPDIGVIVGGPAASLRMEATPGILVCTHVADAVDLMDSLVQRAALN